MTEESLELARTVLRQGELRLDAQLQIALAADQRAVTVMAMFIAIASGALGFGMSFLASTSPNFPLGAGGVATGIILLVSAAICLSAAWPVGFDVAGANPSNWWVDEVTQRSLADSIHKESLNYDRRIRDNATTLDRNAKRLRVGVYLGGAAPIIGVIFWWVL